MSLVMIVGVILVVLFGLGVIVGAMSGGERQPEYVVVDRAKSLGNGRNMDGRSFVNYD